MSQNRTRADAGWVNLSQRPKGPNGRGICRWCGQEVPKGRRTFCGDECVHEWRVRTDPSYVRREVEKRDQEVCGRCGVDTKTIRQERPRNWYCGYHLWEAHHRVPVSEGGGECGLEGYETLCLECHRRETAELAARKAKARKGSTQEGLL